MEDSSLFRNHCILHLQKLQLELKCPLCFKLLNEPVVFPCTHIFCNGCAAMSEEDGQRCPTCDLLCLYQEVRSAPYMENIVRLCRSLEETVNATACQPSSADHFSKKSPSTINKPSNSRKINPSEPPLKRIYATRYEDSVNSSEGVTVLRKARLESEKVHHSSKSVIIIDDDDEIMIKEEPQIQECGVSEFCQNNVSEDEPQTDCCGEANIKSPDRKSAVLKDMLDKGSVNNDSEVGNADCGDMDKVQPDTFTWSATRKRKRLTLRAAKILQEELGHKEKSAKSCSVPHSSPSSKTADAATFICAFCGSSGQNEGTGPLLGFANRKQIDLTNISDYARSKVLIGHQKCVFWSPRVHYDESDCILNLESEVARAAKLKCQSCGKKGASLGCSLDSCQRTYHVPCAFFIPEIRWDCENYLMLCPSHMSCKFPGEMSKSKKCCNREKLPSPSKRTLEQLKALGGKKDLVLCGSALSEEDKTHLDKFAMTHGVNVSQSWNQNVTHVIASTDATGACIQRFEYLMAILNGKWIVKIDWIKACIKEHRLLDELDFEFRPDSYDYRQGPERGRLRLSKNDPKLFAGLRFHFFGDFEPPELNQLLQLVEAAGGHVVSKEMLANNVGAAPRSLFLVYNCTPPQGNIMGDSSFLHRRLREAVDVKIELGVDTISQKWILDSVAAHKLFPFI